MYADGSINIGVWGDDIKETTSLVSYRQNLKPLIRKDFLTIRTDTGALGG